MSSSNCWDSDFSPPMSRMICLRTCTIKKAYGSIGNPVYTKDANRCTVEEATRKQMGVKFLSAKLSYSRSPLKTGCQDRYRKMHGDWTRGTDTGPSEAMEACCHENRDNNAALCLKSNVCNDWRNAARASSVLSHRTFSNAKES